MIELDPLNWVVLIIGLVVNLIAWPSIVWLLRHEPVR